MRRAIALLSVAAILAMSGCDKPEAQAEHREPITPRSAGYQPPNTTVPAKWLLTLPAQLGSGQVRLYPSDPKMPYAPLSWSGASTMGFWTLARMDDGTWRVDLSRASGGLRGAAVGTWELDGAAFNPGGPNQLANPADALPPIQASPL